MNKNNIKILINDLVLKEKDLSTELKKIRETIKSIQKICEHDWKCTGYDSHKDHYTCTICGEFDSY